MNTNKIRLIVFPGGFNWPLWVATEKNWFVENGVDLEINLTPSSVHQISGLINNDFDLAITLIDNVIAYKNNQGEVPIIGEDLIGLMACDTNSLPNLVTLPHIKSYSALKGTQLCVDALTTGYAFLLKAMLEHSGLKDKDFEVVSAGGVQQRYQSLIKKEYSGALFNAPFEGMLREKGFNIIDNGSSVAHNYQGQVLAGNQTWVNTHSELVEKFILVFLKAINWLYDSNNYSESILIFDRNQKNSNAGHGPACYQSLLHKSKGFPTDGKIQLAGVSTVINLRNRYHKGSTHLADKPQAYVNMALLDQVLKSSF